MIFARAFVLRFMRAHLACLRRAFRAQYHPDKVTARGGGDVAAASAEFKRVQVRVGSSLRETDNRQ